MTDRVDEVPETPTLDDLVRMILRASAMGIHVAAPAQVVVYDPVLQRATVQLDLLPVAEIEGEEVLQPPVLIPQIPVAWLGGSTGWVRAPLAPGDTGLVVFTDRCLSVWLTAGGPVDPLNGRAHALGDAVLVPGIRHSANALPVPTNPAATTIEGTAVQLGNAATEPVLKGTTFAALVTAINAAQAAPGAAVTAAPAAADLPTAIALINLCAAYISALHPTITALAAGMVPGSALSTKAFTE